MNLGMDFRGGLERLPSLLENLVARINTVWKKQHTTSGAHQNLNTNTLRVGTYTGTQPVLPLHLLTHPEMLVVDGSEVAPRTQIQIAAAGAIDVFANGAVQFAGTADCVIRFHDSTIVFQASGLTISSDDPVSLASLLGNVNVSAVNGTVTISGSDIQLTPADDIFVTAGGDVDVNSAANVIFQNIAGSFSVDAPDISLSASDDIFVQAASDLFLDATPVTLSQGQLKFPATANPSSNANTLDDYEEGTYTPTNSNISFTLAEGRYTKIGRLVYVSVVMVWPATADANQADFTLPFPLIASPGNNLPGGVPHVCVVANARVLVPTGGVALAVLNDNAAVAITNAAISATGFRAAFSYETD